MFRWIDFLRSFFTSAPFARGDMRRRACEGNGARLGARGDIRARDVEMEGVCAGDGKNEEWRIGGVGGAGFAEIAGVGVRDTR